MLVNLCLESIVGKWVFLQCAVISGEHDFALPQIALNVTLFFDFQMSNQVPMLKTKLSILRALAKSFAFSWRTNSFNGILFDLVAKENLQHSFIQSIVFSQLHIVSF